MLIEVMAATQAILVLSSTHILDLAGASDEATADRLVAALERFPVIGIASPAIAAEQRKVDAILRGEQNPDLWVDIPLRRIRHLKYEPLLNPAHRSALKFIRSIFGSTTSALAAAKEADASLRGALSPAAVAGLHQRIRRDMISNPKAGNPLTLMIDHMVASGAQRDATEQLMAPISELVDSFSSDRIEDSVAEIARRIGYEIAEAEQIGARARTALGSSSVVELGMRHMHAEMQRLGGDEETWLRSASRGSNEPAASIAWSAVKNGSALWHEHAPRVAPGLYLQHVSPYRRMRDRAAKPRDSDWADDQHVCYLPYVDVATVDGAVLSRIRPTLSVIRQRNGFVRRGDVFKNGDWESLFASLRALR